MVALPHSDSQLSPPGLFRPSARTARVSIRWSATSSATRCWRFQTWSCLPCQARAFFGPGPPRSLHRPAAFLHSCHLQLV